ncbi:DsbE family thiol:disulfide interchange protein [Pelagibacteraceae bacterium]|nr:DsbE family thiol:disulfide interchange protein [Pelagibacteraceae bacterium]
MKVNFFKILIFIFVIFFLYIFWLGLKKDNNYNTKNLTGSKITSFQLSSIHNSDLISDKALSQNQFTLINFFASWCAPCRLEHRYLIKLANQNQKIKILGINFKDNKNNALSFLNELGDPYNFVAEDSDGKASIFFGIYGIPESILINQDLTIIKKIVGPIDEKQFMEILKLIQ